MEKELKEKTVSLINETRVMTLAVSRDDVPWSAPVYFVFHDNRFYFFSNEKSLHIQYAKNQKQVAVSIFHDSDRIDQIFGLQMSGQIETISDIKRHLRVVQTYVAKFNFLKQLFGAQILENNRFFLEKFKSRLYCFDPDKIFLSDNARKTEKRVEIDLCSTGE